MEMEFVAIATELVFGFFALFLLTKILGKTQITQITTFDFISALVLGELVGNAVYDVKMGVEKILFTVVIWGMLIYLLEFITQKWRRTRGILEGAPSMVIHKGKIIRDQLKKNKLDMNQLQLLLRAKGAFSIREVEYAVLETDGTISVLKKSEFDKPTRNDLNILSSPATIPYTIIVDGEVVSENLKEAGFDEKWLQQQLLAYSVEDAKDVFYAEWDQNNGLFVQKY